MRYRTFMDGCPFSALELGKLSGEVWRATGHPPTAMTMDPETFAAFPSLMDVEQISGERVLILTTSVGPVRIAPDPTMPPNRIELFAHADDDEPCAMLDGFSLRHD